MTAPVFRLKKRYVPREFPVGPRHGVAAEGQAAVQPLADRSPKQDGTRAVSSRDPTFGGKGVEPEYAEGNQFNEDT